MIPPMLVYVGMMLRSNRQNTVMTLAQSLLSLLVAVAYPSGVWLHPLWAALLSGFAARQAEAHPGLPLSRAQRRLATVLLCLLVWWVPVILVTLLYEPKQLSLAYHGGFLVLVMAGALAGGLRLPPTDVAPMAVHAPALPPEQAIGALLRQNRWLWVGVRWLMVLVPLMALAPEFPTAMDRDWTYAVPTINQMARFSGSLWALVAVLHLALTRVDARPALLHPLRAFPVAPSDLPKASQKEAAVRTVLGMAPLLLPLGLLLASRQETVATAWLGFAAATVLACMVLAVESIQGGNLAVLVLGGLFLLASQMQGPIATVALVGVLGAWIVRRNWRLGRGISWAA